MRLRLLVAALATGCGVPNVTFGQDAAPDLAVDVATESSPALDATDHVAPTSDAPTDSGAPFDATDLDAASADGAGGTMCPQGVPDGASVCCGSVPCRGAAAACQSECTNCENDCPGQTCCLDKHGNYQGCASSPSSCP